MPPENQSAPEATAPAAQAPPSNPASPSDAQAIGQNGKPLTANATLEELLADPATPVAKPVLEIPEQLGRSVAEQRNPETPDTPPVQAAPETPPAEAPAGETEEAAEAAEAAQAAPEAAEPAEPTFDEDAEIARLTEQKLGLLRVQGRKNQELGDLRQRVAAQDEMIEHLRQQVEARAAMPADAALPPDEELAARLLDKPSQYLLTPAQARQLAREEAAALIQYQAQAWQEQQAYEQAAITPAVGVDLFLARNGIKQDWATWNESDEGKAVNNLFARDEDRATLLEAYKANADARGIANTLTKALEAHRLGKKAAQGRHAVNGEKARIDAARPASTPVRPSAPPPPSLPTKNIFSKDFSEADLIEFMRGAEPYDSNA